MTRDLPPPPSVPPRDPAVPPTAADGGPALVTDALLRTVVAGEATAAEAALVRRLAAADATLAARLEAAESLEETLRSDALLPLPLGLVSRLLDGLSREGALDVGAGEPRTDDGARVRAPRPRSRREWLSIAAGAVLALGAGIGGLAAVASAGDLGALVGATADPASPPDASPVASLASLAGEARASTRTAVASLVSAPEQVPGSPGALGLGAAALLGAAVVGVRRSARDAGSRGPSERGPSGSRGAAGPASGDDSDPEGSVS